MRRPNTHFRTKMMLRRTHRRYSSAWFLEVPCAFYGWLFGESEAGLSRIGVTRDERNRYRQDYLHRLINGSYIGNNTHRYEIHMLVLMFYQTPIPNYDKPFFAYPHFLSNNGDHLAEHIKRAIWVPPCANRCSFTVSGDLLGSYGSVVPTGGEPVVYRISRELNHKSRCYYCICLPIWSGSLLISSCCSWTCRTASSMIGLPLSLPSRDWSQRVIACSTLTQVIASAGLTSEHACCNLRPSAMDLLRPVTFSTESLFNFKTAEYLMHHRFDFLDVSTMGCEELRITRAVAALTSEDYNDVLSASRELISIIFSGINHVKSSTAHYQALITNLGQMGFWRRLKAGNSSRLVQEKITPEFQSKKEFGHSSRWNTRFSRDHWSLHCAYFKWQYAKCVRVWQNPMEKGGISK